MLGGGGPCVRMRSVGKSEQFSLPKMSQRASSKEEARSFLGRSLQGTSCFPACLPIAENQTIKLWWATVASLKNGENSLLSTAREEKKGKDHETFVGGSGEHRSTKSQKPSNIEN